jgi:predicted ribosomally synthesized peptide with SipW-like signal peptide
MKAAKRRNIILLVASLVLVLSLTVGLTLAYFSDYTEAKGGKKVTLGGQTTITEEPRDDRKIITIQNTGETDVIVRVAAYGPTEMSYSGSGWTDGGDGYYYYNKIIPVGGKSTKLTVKWTVPEDLGDDYNVLVIHDSDQVVYDASGKIVKPDTTPAWALVPSAN